MNALFFCAAGPGPKPTMLLLHGLPGNERNLDLAQAVRRAGWNVLTFTYRGAWGSEGDFSLANAVEDARVALEFLRSPEASRSCAIDANRIVVAGHSLGGFTAAMSAAGDAHVAGIVLLDAWNVGATAADVRQHGEGGRAALVQGFDDFGHALHGATPDSIANEVIAARNWDLHDRVGDLARAPMLAIYATYGGAEENRALAQAVAAQPGAHVHAVELATDHSFSDHRIALGAEVVRWLNGL